MSAPHPDLLLADDDLEHAAAPAPIEPAYRPAWAARLALAGALFVAAAVVIIVGGVLPDPLANLDVFCAAVTLAVAGGLLRSIASPAGRSKNG